MVSVTSLYNTNTYSQPEAPSFIQMDSSIEEPPITKVVRIASLQSNPKAVPRSVDDAANFLKEELPNINKAVIDDLMDLLFTLKSDKNINHKFRVRVFAKIFECSEKEAGKFYKFAKFIWKFQNLGKTLYKHLKGFLQ